MPIADDLATYVSQWDLTGDYQTYARAIGQMFVEVESYAEDTDTTVGWQPLWDYTIAPHNALPWIAMVYGETAPQNATDDQIRALIQAAPNSRRGTPRAIADAVKQTLTGGQLVGIKERWRSDTVSVDEDAMSIFTYLAQTPDQNAVQAALRRTVPADIDIYYSALTGPTWAALEAGAGGGTWSALISHYGGGTWSAVEAETLALPGYVIY